MQPEMVQAEARRALRAFGRADPVALGSVALAVLYFWVLLSNPALPGQNAVSPLGWWGWFDQGKTLDSARAFASWDLSPGRHWYPLGYSLLAAPFTGMGFRAHPFAVLNLACLVLTLWGFVAFAVSCGLQRGVAAVLFVAAVTSDPQMFSEWAIPWNTTPTAALLWGLLAACARWLRGMRQPLLLGLLAGAVPVFRPTEALVVGVCVAWILAADWWRGTLRRQELAWLLGSGGAVIAAGLALHLAIYGFRPSEYMLVSRRVGFTLHDFGWKAYVILADPYWWFSDGPGMLRRIPWAVLGFAGVLPALVRGRAAGLLAVALVAHLVLYISYVDLLPIGIWRYNNIHYFKWAIPGYALLGWLLVLELVRWRWSAPSLAAAAGLLLAAGLSLVRVSPRAALPGEAVKMLEFRGDAPGFDQSYFNDMTVRDARGVLANVPEFRAFPVPGGMRVIALSRRFEGPVSFEPGHNLPAGLVTGEPDRFVPQLSLGRPCWMPGSRCGRRPTNPLLPR